jgi:uncharacterized protein (DUF1330 family)
LNIIMQGTIMSVFLIADIKVTDGAWVPAYVSKVHDIVHRHGGRYLARSGNIEKLEGPTDADVIALIEFPSRRAAEAFADDPHYAPFAAARQRGSESRLRLIDDSDVAGTISYLPQG